MNLSEFFSKAKNYIFYILVSLSAGGLSAYLSYRGMMSFESLTKPPLTPPAIVFPIVWSILYILMGVGAGLVSKSAKNSKTAIMWFWIQLAINFLWSIFFFRFEWRLFSFFWLLLLIFAVVKMLYEFYKILPAAAYINIPYIIWLLIALYLNLGVYLLNR